MSSTKVQGRSLQDILNSQQSNSQSTNYRSNTYHRSDRNNRKGGEKLYHRNNRNNSTNNSTNNSSNNTTSNTTSNVSKKYNNDVTNPITLDENHFPELLSNTDLNNNPSKLDYKNVVSIVHDDTVKDNYKVVPGWTIIDKKTKKITTYDNFGKIVDRSIQDINTELTQEQINSIFRSMSKRWCQYYDEINEILGDRSPYFNYKEEIEKNVMEDEEIFKKMYDHINDYSSSDDDLNNFDD